MKAKVLSKMLNVDVQIIYANESHIDSIEQIEKLSFAIPWHRQSIIEEITTNRLAVYLVAIVNNMVAGYAGMWNVCGEGHITNIAVHSSYRKMGVGYKLIRELINISKEEGIEALTLEVKKSNFQAQGLYGKHGFSPAGIRKNYYADTNEDAIIMWKKL